MSYPIETWEDHKDCSLGMDISAPFGWWCASHNVDLTEPIKEEA